MTVYPDVESARIDPSVLSKPHTRTPSKLEQLFRDAKRVREDGLPYAFQAGYFWATLQQIEDIFRKEDRLG